MIDITKIDPIIVVFSVTIFVIRKNTKAAVILLLGLLGYIYFKYLKDTII